MPAKPKKPTTDKKVEANRQRARTEFIQALAEFLVKDQAHQSILASMGKPAAQEWVKLRSQTPLHGWPTLAEAVQTLTEFLA